MRDGSPSTSAYGSSTSLMMTAWWPMASNAKSGVGGGPTTSTLWATTSVPYWLETVQVNWPLLPLDTDRIRSEPDGSCSYWITDDDEEEVFVFFDVSRRTSAGVLLVEGYDQEICGSGSPTASHGSSRVWPGLALSFDGEVTTRTGTDEHQCIRKKG